MRSGRPRGLGARAWLTTQVLRRILRVLAFVKFVHVTVENRSRVPERGAVLIASNHISLLDGLFLWGALRRRAVALGMAELWTMPVVGWLVRMLGHVPVRRRDPESGRTAMDSAAAVLRHGGVLIIYPEGRCVSPGEAEPYKPGVAKLALATGVPIVPVGTTGTNRVLPLRRDLHGSKRFNRGQRVRISFGEPIDPARYPTAESLLAELRTRIESLRAPASD